MLWVGVIYGYRFQSPVTRTYRPDPATIPASVGETISTFQSPVTMTYTPDPWYLLLRLRIVYLFQSPVTRTYRPDRMFTFGLKTILMKVSIPCHEDL